MKIDVPVSFGFDYNRPLGNVRMSIGTLPKPEEYFLAPEAVWDADLKEWTITGYGLVHVSQLPPEEVLKNKLKGVTG